VGAGAGRRFNFRVGPALGPHCVDIKALDASSRRSTGRRVCVLSAAILARASARLDPFSLWFSVEPSLLFPAIKILDETTEIASLGRPWLSFSGGLSWRL